MKMMQNLLAMPHFSRHLSAPDLNRTAALKAMRCWKSWGWRRKRGIAFSPLCLSKGHFLSCLLSQLPVLYPLLCQHSRSLRSFRWTSRRKWKLNCASSLLPRVSADLEIAALLLMECMSYRKRHTWRASIAWPTARASCKVTASMANVANSFTLLPTLTTSTSKEPAIRTSSTKIRGSCRIESTRSRTPRSVRSISCCHQRDASPSSNRYALRRKPDGGMVRRSALDL